MDSNRLVLLAKCSHLFMFINMDTSSLECFEMVPGKFWVDNSLMASPLCEQLP